MKLGLALAVISTFTWPVDVQVPYTDEDGNGAFEAHRFNGKFKYLEKEEAEAISADFLAQIESLSEQEQRIQKELEEAKADNTQPDTGRIQALLNEDKSLKKQLNELIAQHQIALYSEIWVGWDDITDAKGKPLEVTQDNKVTLLKKRIIREAVVAAYKDSQNGEAARLKNSESWPAAGPAGGSNSTVTTDL